MLLLFPQIVDGGVGELHGESSQSSVCHLLEKQGNTKVAGPDAVNVSFGFFFEELHLA